MVPTQYYIADGALEGYYFMVRATDLEDAKSRIQKATRSSRVEIRLGHTPNEVLTKALSSLRPTTQEEWLQGKREMTNFYGDSFGMAAPGVYYREHPL